MTTTGSFEPWGHYKCDAWKFVKCKWQRPSQCQAAPPPLCHRGCPACLPHDLLTRHAPYLNMQKGARTNHSVHAPFPVCECACVRVHVWACVCPFCAALGWVFHVSSCSKAKASSKQPGQDHATMDLGNCPSYPWKGRSYGKELKLQQQQLLKGN